MHENKADILVSSMVAKLAQRRASAKATLEDVAAPAGLHRTTISLWEKGERSPTVLAAIQVASALGIRLSTVLSESEREILGPTPNDETFYQRKVKLEHFRNSKSLQKLTGLSPLMLAKAIEQTYSICDIIDNQLIEMGSPRIRELVELANLSSMIGNIFGGALANLSEKKYKRNQPHSYPSLISLPPNIKQDIEIKIALEANKPKGHLAKKGLYMTLRYILSNSELEYTKGIRGKTAFIWEIRLGHLLESDFDISNTVGNSGKTAVIKTESLKKMHLIYFCPDFLPYRRSKDPLLPYPYFN